MSILEQSQTDEYKLDKLKKTIISRTGKNLTNLKQAAKISFDLVWHNDSFTPQEVMDAFGADAYKLFLIHAKTEEFIKVLEPAYVSALVPNEFTISDQFGTVTIGDPI